MMTEEKPGCAAFPAMRLATGYGDFSNATGSVFEPVGGITLLDYFAAKAMQGDMANADHGCCPDTVSDKRLEQRARLYYRMSAAMMKARPQ